MAMTCILPSVIVPVLSRMAVSVAARHSSASALRISAPIADDRPMPATTAVGVASPSAQGHDITSTVVAAIMAAGRLGCGPKASHSAKVMAAIPSMAGTK